MEQAREKMTPQEMCSIYIQGSLIIRSLLPRFLSKVICRRINRRAADIARKTELEGSLAWLSRKKTFYMYNICFFSTLILVYSKRLQLYFGR